MNIAYVGNFVEKKGSLLFTEFVLNYYDQYNFFIFGYIVDNNSYIKIEKNIKKQITYQEGELGLLLKKYRIDCALVWSTWPETFSRTFFNCLQAGVPVITNQLGFPYYYLKKIYPLFYAENQLTPELLHNIIQEEKVINLKNKQIRKKMSELVKSQTHKYTLVGSYI